MNQGSITRTLLQNILFCTVIALFLWQFVPSVGQYGFFSNFVHAQAIGNCIALLAIAFSRWATAVGAGSKWETFLSIVVATVLGVVFGLWLASSLLGLYSNPLDFLYNADHLAITAITAVVASLAFNWYRYRREKLIRLQLVASEEKRRADNAHHAMLRAQLDPHMLFNTLANLRALIGQDTSQALTMLDMLDNFLRETLRSSRASHHTLGQELKVLESYLGLMKIRMAERLTYSFTVSEGCNDIKIPSLLLQPLIENAIRHGLEPHIDGGHINISAYINEGDLTLIVEDNGIGMQTNNTGRPSRIERGKELLDAEPSHIESTGFGLDNLHKRLQQSYGNDASIEFDPIAAIDKTSVGTRVTVRFPANAEMKLNTLDHSFVS